MLLDSSEWWVIDSMGPRWAAIICARRSHLLILVPINIATWLWERPDRFIVGIKMAGSTMFDFSARALILRACRPIIPVGH